MSTLAPLLRELRSTLRDPGESGVAPTGVPGVTFFWAGEPVPRAPLLYSAGIVIIGQGHKVGYLGDRRFVYDAETCLVLGVPVPFECETHATPDEPLLGIRIDVDLAALHGLVGRFGGRLELEKRGRPTAASGVEPVQMEGPLLAATRRLLESLRDPMDRQVVGPAAVEEILYRVLRGEQGRVLYDLTRHHTPYSGVARALERMHGDYRDSLSVDELARESAMGVSSFHRAFKEITGDSPVQYLKKIRLLKAKGLLALEGSRVNEAAYAVGYASPSQFSREFKRYFRVPPSEAATLPYSDTV
jgi:AraC-like DNA-binding protein